LRPQHLPAFFLLDHRVLLTDSSPTLYRQERLLAEHLEWGTWNLSSPTLGLYGPKFNAKFLKSQQKMKMKTVLSPRLLRRLNDLDTGKGRQQISSQDICCH
jgi:hypothetical protein